MKKLLLLCAILCAFAAPTFANEQSSGDAEKTETSSGNATNAAAEDGQVADDADEDDYFFEDEDDKAKSRSAKKQSFFLEFDTGEVLLAGSSLLFLFNCFAVQRSHRK